MRILRTVGVAVAFAAALQAQVIVTPSPLPNAVQGQSYLPGFQFNSIGFAATPNWSLSPIANNNLPPNMNLSLTGILSGTPTTAGIYTFSIRAALIGVSVDKVFQLTVQPPLTLSPGTLPTGSVNTPYPVASFSAAGGTGPYSYSIATGNFPTGLGLVAASGAITGQPTATGQYAFGIRVTDSLGYSNVVTYFVQITNPLQLGPATLPNVPQNSSYSQFLTRSGGSGTLSVSLASGNLPPGLGINAAAFAIIGSPTTQGTYTFTLQLNDTAGSPPASVQYTIQVLPPLVLGPATLPNGSVGVPYPVSQFTASGGTPPYTFSLPQGNLPTGLQLVPSTGAITGLPQVVGTFPFYVSVKDALGYQTFIPSYNVQITNPLVLGPASLVSGVMNVPYSQQLSLSGGVAPYAVSVLGGSLAGLTLNPTTGLINGTPTSQGTFPVTIQLADSVGSPVKIVNYSLVIQPPFVVSPAVLSNGTTGVSYSAQLTTTGGNGSYTYSLGNSALPAGLTLSPAGVLSGLPTQTGTFNFIVRVTDGLQYSATSNETISIYNPLALSPLGSVTWEVGNPTGFLLSAAGGQPPYTFTVISGTLPPGVLMNSSTGIANGTPTTAGSYNFTVRLSDSVGTPPVTQTYPITVLPQLTVTPATLPLGTLTFPYAATISAAGGQPPYSFSQSAGTLPPGLTFDSSTGQLSGTPTQIGTYAVTFRVVDAFEYVASRSYNLQVTAPLTITPATLPNMLSGVPFSQTLTSTGGSGALTWSITGGVLPAGLFLNGATGVISGTPATTGTYSFTVQVADSVGTPPVTRTYSGPVIAPLIVLTNSLPVGTQGVSYTTTLSSTGGLSPITWTLDAGTLPAGLTLNGATGVISGVPTFASTAAITVSAHDSAGQVASRPLSFNLASSLAITTPVINPISTGAPFLMQMSATGGQQPYTWSIASGTLPAGLTLSPGGVLSGTVTQDVTLAVTFRVTDNLGNTDTRAFSVNSTTPIPGISITTTTLPNGNVGVGYSFALGASGGQGSYSWTLSQGALPNGLSMNGAGQITGTPGTAGTFTFGVTVTDGSPRNAGRLFTITIDPALAPLVISTVSVPDTDLNAPYSAAIAASGGKAPYTFSISSAGLPPGIGLSSQGALTGAGTTAGAYSFSVQVQDAVGTKVSKSFAINVLAPLVITTDSLPGGNVNVAYSAGVGAAGGKPPYHFSISSGSLPAGLAMDDSGSITGKPTKGGSFSFTVQVNDSSSKMASKSFTIRIIDTLAILTTSPLPEVVQNQSYSVTFAASGGTTPYTWSLTGGVLPAGLSLNGATGELSGKPVSAASFSLTLQVRDAQGLTASGSFSMNVIPVLTITTTQLAAGTVGSAYSVSLAATGGFPAITWSIASGALPGGLTLSSGGVISGTPAANGSFSFALQAADAKTQKDSRAFTIVVGLPAVSTVGFTGLADTLLPVQQPILGINLGDTFPIPLTGVVTLTFTPDSGADDPAVQFTTGGRTVPFTLPAGTTIAQFGTVPVGVQTGTVSGSITLVVKLLAGTVDVTPNPAPTKSFRIAKAAPVLRTVTVARSSAGFDVTISGFVTNREVTTAQFHFTSAGGVTVQTVDFTQQLGTVFAAWFASTASQPFGSQFTMTQPFTIQGSANAVTSVSVTLSNSIGTSNSITANIP